jgi:hypothetical protein
VGSGRQKSMVANHSSIHSGMNGQLNFQINPDIRVRIAGKSSLEMHNEKIQSKLQKLSQRHNLNFKNGGGQLALGKRSQSILDMMPSRNLMPIF